MAKKKPADVIECEICGCDIKNYLVNVIDRNRYKTDVNPMRVRSHVRLCGSCYREDVNWEESLRSRKTGKP